MLIVEELDDEEDEEEDEDEVGDEELYLTIGFRRLSVGVIVVGVRVLTDDGSGVLSVRGVVALTGRPTLDRIDDEFI